MTIERRIGVSAALLALVLVSGNELSAQGQASAPTTAVLATLTVDPGADRALISKILPEEVRATVQLYLDGKISQWYSRVDGRGVVFLMNCASVDEAKALTDALPLSRAHLVTFELAALRPLGPLRLLLGDPGAAPPSEGK
jgi:hypothetical protein